MAAPTRITDISTTAASNSPTGSESVGTGLDDYLRAIQTVYRLDLASKGADIASASTTDLGAVGGYFHDITGTTTITSFGTVAAGIPKVIKFEGALTLTHNSTSLIIPGGANITTTDGDVAFVISEGSGNWRVISYFKASPPPFPALILIERKTANNSATIDFSTGIDDTYDEYELHITNCVTATDATNLLFQVSQDGGSSFEAGAAAYAYTSMVQADEVFTTLSSEGVTALPIATSTGNQEQLNAIIRIASPSEGSYRKMILWDAYYESSGNNRVRASGSGEFVTNTSAIDAFRILATTGNLTQGNFALYGLRKSQ